MTKLHLHTKIFVSKNILLIIDYKNTVIDIKIIIIIDSYNIIIRTFHIQEYYMHFYNILQKSSDVQVVGCLLILYYDAYNCNYNVAKLQKLLYLDN